jgi:glycosyltransferase involved in cell wall biosynthesis
MLKVVLLADAASSHTQKWALALAKQGLKVGLFSFNHSATDWFSNHENIQLLFQPKSKKNASSIFTKLNYLAYTRKLKKAIQQFAPDIVHAHYATSYGLVGRLSGFHPFVISAWGTDVMKFPEQGGFNKKLLVNNFKQADLICATSNTIKDYINKVIDKPVKIIPFGVDCEQFVPPKQNNKNEIVIGCIKSLEPVYRIEMLINAFKAVLDKSTDKKLRLLIVGGGSLENQLKDLCKQLNIVEQVTFTGKVQHSEVISYYQQMDVFCNLSEYESFGVSIIEAMACELPVVATDTGGAKDIITSDDLGVLVAVNSLDGATKAILQLTNYDEIRGTIGKKARAHVLEKYDWNSNITEMITQYKNLVK